MSSTLLPLCVDAFELVCRQGRVLGDDGGQLARRGVDSQAQLMPGAPLVDARCTTPSRQPRPSRVQGGLGKSLHFFVLSNSKFYVLTNHCILSLCLQSASHEDQECNEFMSYCMAHMGRATSTSPTTRRIHPRPTATRASTRASLSTRRWERCSMGTHEIQPPSPFLEKPS